MKVLKQNHPIQMDWLIKIDFVFNQKLHVIYRDWDNGNQCFQAQKELSNNPQ